MNFGLPPPSLDDAFSGRSLTGEMIPEPLVSADAMAILQSYFKTKKEWLELKGKIDDAETRAIRDKMTDIEEKNADLIKETMAKMADVEKRRLELIKEAKAKKVLVPEGGFYDELKN